MAGVVMYNIAGRQVGAHWLAMATLGVMGAIPFFMGGGKTGEATKQPPMNASSKDEEAFIQEFMRQAEKEDKKH